MKRVVSLMHRQAVRQKAEGLYFMVSTLYLFKQIMAEERTLPREQPYKDLVALINYILRKFFKAVEEDSFLIIEVRPFFAVWTRLAWMRQTDACTHARIGLLPKESWALEAVLEQGARRGRPTTRGPSPGRAVPAGSVREERILAKRADGHRDCCTDGEGPDGAH